VSRDDRRRLARALADRISEEQFKDMLDNPSFTADAFTDMFQEILDQQAPIWKTERPTTPGLYYLKNGQTTSEDGYRTFGPLTIVEVQVDGVVDFLGSDWPAVVGQIEGEWAGPLEPPT
jgi:hypothetical protein